MAESKYHTVKHSGANFISSQGHFTEEQLEILDKLIRRIMTVAEWTRTAVTSLDFKPLFIANPSSRGIHFGTSYRCDNGPMVKWNTLGIQKEEAMRYIELFLDKASEMDWDAGRGFSVKVNHESFLKMRDMMRI